MNRLALLLAVAGAHTAYYAVPEGDAARGWIAYVGTHALLIVALALLLPWAQEGKPAGLAAVGLMACWWGIIESAQAVGCSLLMWGTLSQADLCEQAFGRDLYVAACAMALAWIIVGRRRHGRTQ